MRAVSSNGSMLSHITGWYAGEWTEEINRPHSLTFTVPDEWEFIDDLAFPNQVWLYDQRDQLQQEFHIIPHSRTRGGPARTRSVSCKSLLNQTADEVAIGYTATNKPIKDIVRELFALQTATRKLHVGRIDNLIGDVTRTVLFDGINLWSALEQLRNSLDPGVEGYFHVDTNRGFRWLTDSGFYKGQQIVYRKNMQAITRQEDPSGIVTRLWVYGAGDDISTRVKLSDADGYALDYVDKNTGTYGVHQRMVVFRDVQDPNVLLQLAKTRVDRWSRPRYNYAVDAIALEHDDPEDFEFERLTLGSRVWVIDEEMDVNELLRVEKIVHNLDEPLDQTLVIGDRIPELKDYIGDLNRRVEILENSRLGPAPPTLTPVNIGILGALGLPGAYATETHTHGLDASPVVNLIQNNTEVINALTSLITQVINPLGIITAATRAALPTTGLDQFQLGGSTSDSQLHYWDGTAWRTISHWRTP